MENNRADFDLLTGLVVHTADLYVPTKPQAIAKQWSSMINQEFINQNQLEKKLKIPETPFYKNLDVMKVVAKSENFFISKIVSPLWIEMDRFLDGVLKKQRKNLKNNEEYWKKVLQEELKKEEELNKAQKKK